MSIFKGSIFMLLKTFLIISVWILFTTGNSTIVYSQACTARTCTGPSDPVCANNSCGACTAGGYCTDPATSDGICCSTPSACTDPLKPNCNSPEAGQERCDSATYGELRGQRNYCQAGTTSDPAFRIPNYREIGQSGFKFFQGNPNPTDIGLIISDLLPYVYVIAGLLLFVYLIYGGFHLLTSFGSPKAILEAWLIVFRALVGFVMIFVSFWLIQLVEIVFGMKIL